MSSASPRGQPLGQPGRYVGEYKEVDGFLCPRVGEILTLFYNYQRLGGGGIHKFEKDVTGTFS